MALEEDADSSNIQLGGLADLGSPSFGLASPPAHNDAWTKGAFGAAFPLVEVAPPAAEMAAGLKAPSTDLQRV